MEYKQIQELLKSIDKSTITELSIKDGDFEITIRKDAPEVADSHFMQMPMMPQMMMPQMAQQMPMQQAQQLPQAQSAPAAAPADSKPAAAAQSGKEIKSPMIGTFYRAASPDKPPFVQVGDEVKKGQVLCVIEAMKLFNEIECEMDGKIIKVLADDASPVEYDQPLFLIG